MTHRMFCVTGALIATLGLTTTAAAQSPTPYADRPLVGGGLEILSARTAEWLGGIGWKLW
jgi:hypothetical protein